MDLFAATFELVVLTGTALPLLALVLFMISDAINDRRSPVRATPIAARRTVTGSDASPNRREAPSMPQALAA